MVPFLRWAGSKRQILGRLCGFWKPDHGRYIEPFAGSACLFFRLAPHRAVLGDINRELIRTYLEVKYRLPKLIELLDEFDNSKQQYLDLRALDPNNLDGPTRAARFIFLNRFCFNGLYRTNLKGQFNVPYSGDKTGALPTPDHLRRCRRLLRKARLVCGDFDRVLRVAEAGDFVYLDPPFSVNAKRVFREYDPSLFSFDDVRRLRSWLKRLNQKNVSFLVSYAESEESEFLGRGFSSRTIKVRRSIAGFTHKRLPSREVLIHN